MTKYHFIFATRLQKHMHNLMYTPHASVEQNTANWVIGKGLSISLDTGVLPGQE